MQEALAGAEFGLSVMVAVHIVRAFTANGGGGNLAGVVLEGEGIPKQARQKIAATLKLSEIAFLSAAGDNNFRVEFFTPTKQIDLCGHATIAAYSLLREQGKLSGSEHTMETGAGDIPVRLQGDLVFMEQSAPAFTELDESELDVVLVSLRADHKALDPRYRPQIVTTGKPFLIVGIKDLTQLLKVAPNHSEISEVSAHYDLVGYYLFTQEVKGAGHHASTRMFAPHYGIKEESATGMAAGPLGCVLAEKLGVSDDRLLIEQGYLMRPPSPSHLVVDLVRKDRAVTAVYVGGSAKLERIEQVTL